MPADMATVKQLAQDNQIKPLIQLKLDIERENRSAAGSGKDPENLDIVEAVNQALVDIGRKHQLKPLLQALKDSDLEVRLAAADALGEIGDPAALPALLKVLEDKHHRARIWAASNLGKIGDPQALEPLIVLLKDREFAVRAKAIEALGMIGDTRALPILQQHLENTPPKAYEHIVAERVLREFKPRTPGA